MSKESVREMSACGGLVVTLRDLEEISSRITRMREKRIAQEKLTKSRFSVFTVLLPEHDEVRLHTRFLHCLLNPAGVHDCGNLFVDAFFEILSEIPPLDHNGNHVLFDRILEDQLRNNEYLSCQSERYENGFGQFDLFMEFKLALVLIENKIYAAEGYRQLERYGSYLKSRKDKSTLLLYLTLDGKQSYTAADFPYARISYNNHIKKWLLKCAHLSKEWPHIHQSILQYQKIISSLCGDVDMNPEEMKEVKVLLQSNPDVIRNLDSIRNVGVELFKDVMVDFFDQIRDELSKGENGEVILCSDRPGMVAGGIRKDLFGGLILRPTSSDFLQGFASELWLERNYDWKALYVGIESKWYKNTSPEELARLNMIREKLNALCVEVA